MQKNLKPYLSRDRIRQRVEEMAELISRDYRGKTPILVGVLKGAVIFLSDLIRCLDIPVKVDFIAVSSYGASTKTSGIVRILKDLDRSIENEDVLIVEDIIDTGLTIKYLMETLKQQNPNSLKVVTLLDKPERRKVEIVADYRGMVIPNKFVVGYGLDYNENYRYLPEIYSLE